eukprot:gene1634-1975_t
MSSDVPSTASGTGVFIPACILDGSALKNPAVFGKFPRKRRGSAISTSSGGSSKSDKSSSPASARSDSPARDKGTGKGHKQQHKDRAASEVPVVDHASAPDQQEQQQEQMLEVDANSSNSSNFSGQPGEASTSTPAAKNPFAATPRNIRQQQLLCNLVAAADSFTDPAAPPAAALGTVGLPWGSSNSASSRAPGHELPRTPAAGKSMDLTRTNSRTSLDSSYYQYAARNSMDVRSSMDFSCNLLHVQPQGYHSIICNATRDVQFAYQKDIQTKLKPGVFAERMENRYEHLQAAQDWKQVVELFGELGPDAERNVGLVVEMLVALQRLAPLSSPLGAAGAALSPAEARQLAAGIQAISSVLLDRLDKVNNKHLISIIWALALLPDPSKTVSSPAATAARARAVAGFGAAVLTRMNKLMAEELFHVFAGLTLLGFKPPRTLTRDVPEQDAHNLKMTGQPLDADTAEMQQPPPGPVTFASLLERRSIKVMPYVNAKGFADAGFVVSRLVPAGDMSQEWLRAYAE